MFRTTTLTCLIYILNPPSSLSVLKKYVIVNFDTVFFPAWFLVDRCVSAGVVSATQPERVCEDCGLAAVG